MCTLICFNEKKKFLLGFARDENRSRRHIDYNFEKIWYPKDSKTGGSWIGVNRKGHVAALLNGETTLPKKKQSRASIIIDVLENDASILNTLELELYSSFRLFYYNKKNIALYTWQNSILSKNDITRNNLIILSSTRYYDFNKREKEITDTIMQKTSKSKEIRPTIDLLKEIFKTHFPRKGTHSICMHGTKSKTIGLTLIEIKDNQVTILDKNSSPCLNKDFISTNFKIV